MNHRPISAHAFVNGTLLQRVYDPAQMLTCTQVAALLSVDNRTIWRMVEEKRHGFPQPIRYNRKLVRWKYTDVLAWVERQGRDGETCG